MFKKTKELEKRITEIEIAATNRIVKLEGELKRLMENDEPKKESLQYAPSIECDGCVHLIKHKVKHVKYWGNEETREGYYCALNCNCEDFKISE